MAKDLVKTLADLKENEALKIVEDRLTAGEDPLNILDDARRRPEGRPDTIHAMIDFTKEYGVYK